MNNQQTLYFRYPRFSPHRVNIQTYAGDYIGETIRRSGCFYESALFERYEAMFGCPKTVLDVGANIGNHTVYWARACQACVYAFEPYPESFSLLKQNITINDLKELVQVFPFACGAFDQTVSMEIPDPGNVGTSRVVSRPGAVGQVKATMVTLDTWAKANQPERPVDLVKIDTEGYELDVLRGMTEMLEKDRPTLWIEAREQHLPEVVELLKPFGLLLKCRPIKSGENYFFSKDTPRPFARQRARIRASLTRSRISRRISDAIFEGGSRPSP